MSSFPSRRLLLASVPLLVLLAGCGNEAPPEPLPPRPVKMLEIGGVGARTLEFPGEIRPARQADMAFEVPGKIIAFPAREAQRVARGELLARLDPRDYEADLDKARANLAKAKTDLERYRTLYREGVTAKAELEVRERRFEAAQASHAQAEKAVEEAVLRAPFDGVVAQKLVEDFSNVQAKEVVLVLQDDTSLEIRVSVPEQDFARMQPGLSLEERTKRAQPRVHVSSIPDRSFPARLTEFSTAADPTTRTYRATFAFDDPPDVNVLPGMTARVVVRLPRESGSLTLPASAVLSDEGGEAHVWVVDPGSMTVAKAPVETGTLAGDSIEILSGLEPGQTVAISGVHQLREGLVVRRFER